MATPSSSAAISSSSSQSSAHPSSQPATSSPTPTPSTATTTTSNAPTASPTSSSSSTTAAISSATSSQPSSSTAAVSSSAFVSAQVITSDGSVQTITATSFVISTATPTSQSNATSSSNSFFSNTGAVAGVFTVVGLIVAGLVIALIINAVRRHRAKEFDRDVAQAAAEAAAMSRSPFEDYSYGNSGGNAGGGGYGYSNNSQGTFQLPPLQAHNEAYGMSEMSQYDPYAAGVASLAASAVGRSRSRKDSEPGAPGIAGVGAGTLGREPSKRAPYHAFAGPATQPHDLQNSNGTFRSRRSNQDVLQAAGLAAVGAAAIASNNHPGNGPSSAYVTRQPSDAAQTTLSGRSKFGSMSSSGHHPPTLQPGYPVDSYYPHRSDSLSPDPFAGYPPVTVPSKPLPNPHDVTLPSPSLPGHQSEHNEDYGESGSPIALRSEEQRTSYQDDTDYSQSHRVLRVANE